MIKYSVGAPLLGDTLFCPPALNLLPTGESVKLTKVFLLTPEHLEASELQLRPSDSERIRLWNQISPCHVSNAAALL